MRSRGDRDEPFGGVGRSLPGRRAVPRALALCGNFPDHSRMPDDR